ncbi:MAG: hypothetical protein FJ087_01705 [Deltaproteobacteria bacterium]|nr:hypothetical protein [Deltaproteobacteria bacterium]
MTPSRARNAALLLAALAVAAQAWIGVRDAGDVPEGSAGLGFPHVPTDHHVYMMITEQARENGGLFHRNLSTTEPQDGRFLMLGLTATGRLAEALSLSDATAWHGVRLAIFAALAAVLWSLCRALWRDPGRALSGFAAVLLGGGLDWALRRAIRAGWMTEPGPDWWGANPWNYSVFWTGSLATWTLPLLLFSALVLLEVAHPAADSPPGRRPLRAAVRGLGVAAMWAVHPYSAITYGALAAAATVAFRRVLAAAPILGGLAAVAAHALWAREDPVYAATSDQAFRWKAMTPWHLYPVAYGPWALLALAGLGRDRDGERGFAWVRGWLAIAIALSFNPVVTAAKFQFLVTVPLFLLAVRGAWRLADRFAPRRGPWLVAAGVAVAALGAIDGIAADWRNEPNRVAASARPELLAALDDLRQRPDGGVLCDPADGAIVPWKTGKPVFVGHWFLSTRFAEKADLVRFFFAGPATPPQRAGMLRAARIRYVLYGPRERRLGSMPQVPGLSRVGGPESHQVWEFADVAGDG